MNNLICNLWTFKNYLFDNNYYRASRLVSCIANSLDTIDVKGFKHFTLLSIWNFLIRLDEGEHFDYETAPYCGHHHCGFENKYLKTHFHEGDGGGVTKFSIFGYKLYYDNIDGMTYYINK